MRLLLAEDNALNRDMLARRLRRRGYEVLEAADGALTLELLRTQPPPEVLLLDLDMPQVDGWGVLQILREQELIIPTLILSAHSLKDERRRACELGVSAYFTKPLDFEELLRHLEALRPLRPDSSAV